MEKNTVRVAVKGVMPTSNGCAVFLGNKKKTFVIYVDPGVGNSIRQAVNKVRFERPPTHNLMIALLEGLGAEVERVVVNHVEEGTFYARLIVSMKNEIGRKIVEIDARPSDSIVLSVLSRKPLYAAASVFDKVDDMTEILEKILRRNEESD